MCARCADLSLTSFAGAICSLCARLNEQELKGALATACTPRLQLLMLGYCGRGLSDAAVNATLGASDNCVPSLRELTLHGAYRLTDAGLAALLRGAPSLATLAVRRTAPLHSFSAPVSQRVDAELWDDRDRLGVPGPFKVMSPNCTHIHRG